MTKTLRTVSGTTASKMIFGTMQFGGNADARASADMFQAALDAGINHFDTAYAYTGGASEEILGNLARNKREDLFVATKVGYVGGADRSHILAQFEVSERRLSLEYVDLLYMHRFDTDIPLSETFEVLAELQSEGRIRHIGVSNYAAWQVMKAQALAQGFGTQIDVLQPMYNLVKRQAEVELLPMCLDQDIIPATYSPLGGGLLTGKYGSGGSGRLTEDSRYGARYGLDWMHQTAQDFANLAREIGVSPAALAVAWVLHAPFNASPIVSARNVDQLRPSLDALTVEMSDELYDQITALSPTPAPATDRLEEA